MMYQNDAEVMFPARVIPMLRDLRGKAWAQLIDRICSQEAGNYDEQALTLMMIRLDGCLTCHADSYRAMRGCTLCAQQTITRFKGTDDELIEKFEQARIDVCNWHETGNVPPSERLPEDS